MPSASISLNNMSQIMRDTYQANGLIRSHQQSTFASSQTSLQKLPAASPQFLYHTQQQQQQQQIQFPAQPPTQPMAQMVPQNMQPPKNSDNINPFNPLIVPQQQQLSQLNNMPINMLPQIQHQQMNGISASNTNLTQQPILMSPMVTTKNSHNPLHMQQMCNQYQTQTMANQQSQQQHQSVTTQTLNVQSQPKQNHQPISSSQQQVPMTTIMIPATAAAHIQSASMQIQQAAMQATANMSAPNFMQTPQILVLMIPPMISQPLPPTIPPTPDQNSSNSTLVRQSHLNSSLMRQSNQNNQTMNAQPQQSQQQLVQQQSSTSHSRAVSSLSNSTNKQPEQSEKFYVKANFSFQAPRNRQELSFQKGEILHVLDTLQNNKDYGVQYWLATRVKPNGEDAEKGLIPNKAKAEEIALEQRTMNIGEVGSTLDGGSSGVLGTSVGRVSFLKRRSAQRSKSLCKDNWDNVVFDIGSFKLPVYERVVYKHPGFCRPVVIFGPLSDIAREKLLRDYPEKYSYPAGLSQSPDHPKVIRLRGVLEVIDQGKHALLDITAPAVEKLNFVNLAPIVIFMKTDSKSIIKEFRSRAAKSLDPNARDEDTLRRDGKSSRKLLEQSMKLEKQWFHVFTAVLDLSAMGSEMWYRKLRETIESQQSVNVWMGEKKADKKLATASSSMNVSQTSANVSANGGDQMLFSATTSTNGSNHFNGHNNQQSSTSNSTADNTTILQERFNECLNISSTKSTNDLQLPLVPPSDGTYGNRSQLRNAYAHSLAQKLARASSEPKLNGLLSDNDDFREDDNEEDDDDDEDDEIIKKPFPSEYENSSSISSSNGAASYGQCSLTGTNGTSSAYQYHYQVQPVQQMNKPPPPTPDQSISSQLGSRLMTPAQHQQSQQHSEGIYSTRNQMIGNSSSSYVNGNSNMINQHHNHSRDYHPLPPINAGDSNYGNHVQHNQIPTNMGQNANGGDPAASTMLTNSSNNNNIIDLSRNHEARGSAFQVYSDMNQNNYQYFNINKI